MIISDIYTLRGHRPQDHNSCIIIVYYLSAFDFFGRVILGRLIFGRVILGRLEQIYAKTAEHADTDEKNAQAKIVVVYRF